MKEECQIKKLLTAYPVDYTLLAGDMSEDDLREICGMYGLEEGEYLLSFYGCHSLRSFSHGVVMTDRRLVAGQKKFSGIDMNLESFPWEDLRFVMDDIKTAALSDKVKLPNGRFFRVNLSPGKFHELMKKLAPVLESFNGESGLKITAEIQANALAEWDEVRGKDVADEKARIDSGMRFGKWLLVGAGALVLFVVLGKFYLFIKGATQSKGQFTDKEICWAGIALTSGKSLPVVKYGGATQDFYWFSYVRSVDQTRWKFRCKVDGARVVWATANGPWRTRGSDWPISWAVNEAGDVLGVLEDYRDGSTNFKKYRKADF